MVLYLFLRQGNGVSFIWQMKHWGAEQKVKRVTQGWRKASKQGHAQDENTLANISFSKRHFQEVLHGTEQILDDYDLVCKLLSSKAVAGLCSLARPSKNWGL